MQDQIGEFDGGGGEYGGCVEEQEGGANKPKGGVVHLGVGRSGTRGREGTAEERSARNIMEYIRWGPALSGDTISSLPLFERESVGLQSAMDEIENQCGGSLLTGETVLVS
jgi:hypothetical protein